LKVLDDLAATLGSEMTFTTAGAPDTELEAGIEVNVQRLQASIENCGRRGHIDSKTK
jgi:hypothetical protein